MRKRYSIKLSSEERDELEKLSRRRNAAAGKVIKARALLLCDQSGDGPGLKDPEVVTRTGIKDSTLERLRKRCCEVGPLEALERKAQENRTRKFTGEEQARLTTLACSQPPEGQARWTLHLPARPGMPGRYDAEYIRHGSASAFVIYAPLEGRKNRDRGGQSQYSLRGISLCDVPTGKSAPPLSTIRATPYTETRELAQYCRERNLGLGPNWIT